MATHVIRVHNGTATPYSEQVAVGDVVRWVGPPGSMVGIYFGARTPVEWQSNNGPTVTGNVQKVSPGSYRYKPKHSLMASEPEPEPEPAMSDEHGPLTEADPELIVSGGLQPKREPTTPAKPAASVKRTKKATKRAATKRAKATTRASSTKRAKTKSAKTTRRAKSTKRAKATTRAKPTKRTKATKRAKPAKRAKR